MASMRAGGMAPRWLWAGAGVVALPAVAGWLFGGMDWGWGDHLAWALLVLAAGGGLILAARMGGTRRQRLLVVAGVSALALLVWVELAVGLFGPG